MPTYLGLAPAQFVVSTALAVFASHRLQLQQAAAGPGLSAFLAWFGPVVAFVFGLLGLLSQCADVQEREWILLLVAAVLLPLAAWFLHRQATQATRAQVHPEPAPN